MHAGDNEIIVNGKSIRSFSERDPGRAAVGRPRRRTSSSSRPASSPTPTKAKAHRDAGAKKVIISAPAKNEDITIVLGVNEDRVRPGAHHVVSNASCTTNGLALPAKVIFDTFGIERGLMTTVHSYTNDQNVLDVYHKDLRRARSAGQNIIPTTTGAAKAVALVIPELKGKFDGFALRVPTPTVSVIDFVAITEKPVTAEASQRGAARRGGGTDEGAPRLHRGGAGEHGLQGRRPIAASSTRPSTMVTGDHMVKVIAWYDNEWGYSCRVADLAAFMAERL